MSRRSFWRSFTCFALFAFGSLTSTTLFGGSISVSPEGVITDGTSQLTALPGNAPNGSPWSSFVTGNNPVAYFNLLNGSLMFDPKGRNVNAIDFRWGTTSTINAATPGPYVFTTGTGNNAVSSSSVLRTLPNGSWSAVTTFPARLSANVSFTTAGTLFTSGGNISSTTGWFNLPWSFGAIAPSVTTTEQMYATTAGQGFRSLTAGGNLLGYGNGIGMFLYITSPSAGNQYGAIVPVVPEPSTLMLAGLGVAGVGLNLVRRARRK